MPEGRLFRFFLRDAGYHLHLSLNFYFILQRHSRFFLLDVTFALPQSIHPLGINIHGQPGTPQAYSQYIIFSSQLGDHLRYQQNIYTCIIHIDKLNLSNFSGRLFPSLYIALVKINQIGPTLRLQGDTKHGNYPTAYKTKFYGMFLLQWMNIPNAIELFFSLGSHDILPTCITVSM